MFDLVNAVLLLPFDYRQHNLVCKLLSRFLQLSRNLKYIHFELKLLETKCTLLQLHNTARGINAGVQWLYYFSIPKGIRRNRDWLLLAFFYCIVWPYLWNTFVI